MYMQLVKGLDVCGAVCQLERGSMPKARIYAPIKSHLNEYNLPCVLIKCSNPDFARNTSPFDYSDDE